MGPMTGPMTDPWDNCIYIYMYWSIHSLKLTCSLKMMMVSNRNPLFQKSISGAMLVQGCVDMGYIVLKPIFPPPRNEKKPWNHHGFQVLQLQGWRHLGYQVSEFQRGKVSNKKLGNSIHICWWFRNPANSPVEVGRKSHYLHIFTTIQTVVGLGISEPSTVGIPLPTIFVTGLVGLAHLGSIAGGRPCQSFQLPHVPSLPKHPLKGPLVGCLVGSLLVGWH